jgi:hypothetical protein
MQERTIGSLFLREVAECRFECDRARRRISQIRAEFPRAPLLPDEALKIANAVQDYRSALDTYTRIVDEFSAFVFEGTVPDRLKNISSK